MSQELDILHKDFDFTDFSQDKIIEYYRVIIAAKSPVLKLEAMLKSQMKETAEQQFQLYNISPQALDILVQYIYTG